MRAEDTILVFRALLRILLYGFIIAGMVELIRLDGMEPNAEFGEDSFSEWAQEISLAVIAIAFFWVGKKFPDKSAFTTLMAGMALMGLIREYNNFFQEHFFVGAWTTLLLLTGIITTYLVYLRRHKLVSAITDFIHRPSFGLMVAGFLTIVVFSRLFGLPSFWEPIMGDTFMRPVMRVAEEGTELLGYTILMLGALEYAVSVWQQQKKATNSTAAIKA
jgi:hypothetical protein